MIHNSISSYIDAKTEYDNVRWKINEFGSFAMVDGVWLEEKLYKEKFSKPVYEPPVLTNPDGTFLSAGIKTQTKQR